MLFDTKEDILRLGDLDPSFESFYEDLNEPPVDHTDLEARRAFGASRTKDIVQQLAAADPDTRKTFLSFPCADGTYQSAVLYQPFNPTPSSPLIVIFHGGGFCVGVAESEEANCRSFVNTFGAVCVSIEYRLAPQHTFPTAPSDAWDALQFAAKNAKSWGANPEAGFLVGGTSAGGNLAANLVLRARDEKLSPPITGQFLLCAWLCGGTGRIPEDFKQYAFSYEQNKQVPVLPQETIETYVKAYKPDFGDDLFDALNHSTGHANVPRTYFAVSGRDPFRDEDLIYAKMLKQKGSKVELDVFPGMPHGFWIFYPTFPGSQIARGKISRGIEWLLKH